MYLPRGGAPGYQKQAPLRPRWTCRRRGWLEPLGRWPPKHNLIHLPRCHSHTTCHVCRDTGREALNQKTFARRIAVGKRRRGHSGRTRLEQDPQDSLGIDPQVGEGRSGHGDARLCVPCLRRGSTIRTRGRAGSRSIESNAAPNMSSLRDARAFS